VSRPRFNSKSSIPIGAKVEIAPPPPKTLNTRRQISKIKIEHYLIFSNVQKMLEREREREMFTHSTDLEIVLHCVNPSMPKHVHEI
jgi:hypothetical protein